MDAIKSRAASYYEQSADEQAATRKLVRDEAARNPVEFAALVEQEKFDGLNCLPVLYEALAADLTQWADFFLAEAQRLLRYAKAAANPKLVLTHFEEFSFIEPAKFKHRQALLKLLVSELQNPNSAFRLYLINTLEELATASDVAVIQQLQTLANDPNWRIRYKLHLLAKDSKVLDGPINLSWLDYARAKFLNPFDFA